jgi:hypothetical protein
MNIYIQTRSVTRDYQFLGNSPMNSWWVAYKDYTSFEHPTIIVEGDTYKQWRVYLSGMSSSRLDKVNTPIRYTLILEDTQSIHDSDLPQVLGLIQAWAKAIYDDKAKDKLRNNLDNLFSTEDVDTYFSSLDRAKEQIESKFKHWVSSFTFTDASLAVGGQTNSYIGSLQQSQNAFFQRCKSILKMDAVICQAALYLNYIESKNELENTQLVEEEYKFSFTLLVEDEKTQCSEVKLKKKVRDSIRIQPQTERKKDNKKIYLLIVVIVIVMILALLF